MRVAWIVAAAALACLAAALIWNRVRARRLRRLAARAEDFLNGGEPLDFSTREDELAPLHNAVAELEGRCALARERLAEECRRTDALTSDISHQLKTPLASLRLFCEMDEGPHMAEQLAQIERMERLIYSLLRLERLCADGYSFHFEPHDVGDILREAWREVSAALPGRILDISGDAVIRCDDVWLGEALANLLKNACQYTPPGGRIRAALEVTPTSFFCTVSDRGGGVDARDLPRLFERFYRAGTQQDGSGLGLAIAREIVRRHHGSIRAENADGGLTISIDIPMLNLAKS